MLFVFIIIKLTFEVSLLWLYWANDKTRFSRLRLAITINSHILLGGQLFTGGGAAPSGP